MNMCVVTVAMVKLLRDFGPYSITFILLMIQTTFDCGLDCMT
jgi:hypothetical protein